MFASETLLKNVTIAVLELCTKLQYNHFYLDNNQTRWQEKTAVITDRALYLYEEGTNILMEIDGKFLLFS